MCHTDDVIGHMNRSPEGFTGFSLSDLPSYLDPAGFDRLLAAMVRAARPGARFCIRQFTNRYPIPERFKDVLRRESALEKELRLEDRACAYHFIVGTVAK